MSDSANRYPSSRGLIFVALWCSVAYTVAILFAFGLIGSEGCLYPGSEPYLNLQAAALANGSFALSKNPAELAFDLAWTGTGVQQVWGLTGATWILLLAALSQTQPLYFPSRLAFGLALVIVSSASSYQVGYFTCKRLRCAVHEWKWWIVFAPTVLIVFCFPSFCATLGSCFRIYEEIVAYAYLHAICISILLVRLCANRTPWRFLLLAAVAGVGPFTRPTVAVYGGAAVIVGAFVCLSRGLRWRTVLLCCSLYLGLSSCLLWTNAVRFGSPLEFGHSLNLSNHAVSLYCTRFDYPYAREPVFSAFREIAGGLLFDGRFNHGGWLSRDVFDWQSLTPRWRENYLPAIGWPMILVTALCASVSLLSPAERRSRFVGKRVMKPVVYFAALSALGLACFYLRVPSLSSRYLYDFGAAISTAAGVTWWYVAGTAVLRGKICAAGAAAAGIALCLYLFYRAGNVDCAYKDVVSCSRANFEEMLGRVAVGRKEPRLSGCVQLVAGALQGSLGLPFEGFGWNAETGQVGTSTIHFVRDADFLEIEVSPLGANWTPSPETIHAKMGIEYLTRNRMERVGDILKVRFILPADPKYRFGIHTSFIAWVSPDEVTNTVAPWLLHRLSWKAEDGKGRADDE